MMQQKMPVQLGGGPPGKADKPGLPSSRPNSANTGPSTPQVGSFQHKLLVTFDVESNKRELCTILSILILILIFTRPKGKMA